MSSRRANLHAHAAAFGLGALFAVGLALSGMTKASKIVAFLDLAGAWDPSLALVMVGAVGVHLVASRLVLRRSTPLFDVQFHLPTRKDIDLRLVTGAAVFGVGWGLAGFCPGPGIVSAGSGAPAGLVFVAGMTAGILLEHAAARALAQAHAREPAAPHATPSSGGRP
jgi:uncharacterized membrane protein YedE/YeeE